jgi:hypothetical protein
MTSVVRNTKAPVTRLGSQVAFQYQTFDAAQGSFAALRMTVLQSAVTLAVSADLQPVDHPPFDHPRVTVHG